MKFYYFLILFIVNLINIEIYAQNNSEDNSENKLNKILINEDRDFLIIKNNYQLEVDKNNLIDNNLSPFKPKMPTPSRLFSSDISMPEIFANTNNLAKKPGSFYRAYGEIIYIQGNVSDSFGVPIHNAVIEIWQTNSAGKYHTLLESGSGYIDKFFSMSGRAITDNIGNYHFITIMPGSTPGRAPHINMNIYHQRFGKLETELYFLKHPYNSTDYQFMSYSEDEKKLLTADVRNTDILNPNSIKIVTFNITLKGVHQYKKF